MSNILYVGNLPFNVKEEQIHDLFYRVGKVRTTRLVQDKSQSRGIAYVEMNSEEEAENAIKKLNGQMLGKRKLVVSEARPQESRGGSRRSFGPANRTGSHRR